jgi:hypothetical protein
MKKLSLTLIIIFTAGILTANATEDVVLQWQRVLGQTMETPGQHPGNIHPMRSFAMMNLAMFDAINSIEGGYHPYLTDVLGSKRASTNAAAARAARDVLAGLYPTRADLYDAELSESLAGIPANRARQGEWVGSIVAQRMLALRADDGWAAPWAPYQLDLTPGNWQGPTPFPGFAVFTNVLGVTPFAMNDGSQFLPTTPPSLSSTAYADSFNEVKELGSATSAIRTPDQTLTAFLWANPPVSDGKMFGVVASTSIQQGLTTLERARLFALVCISFHDALQTTLTSQYTYGRWRPVTAVQRADEDGNAATVADPSWESLLGPAGTPPHPSYASNASSVSASVANTLTLVYGNDNIPFQIDHGSGVVRAYPNFSALTNEIARSRVYGGVHFSYDTIAGQQAGRDVAAYAFSQYMTPR